MNHQINENESTYFVEDRSSKDDLARLRLQDQMLTQVMGGVLPEQPDPSRVRRVLDVGCGTGGWLIATAQTYPEIETLVGIDISRTMVESARLQAEVAGVSHRVRFQVMDALRRLEFPSGYFDLVNQRAGASYLRTWDWPKLLQEYHRVTRTGGVLRITEGEWGADSTSQALTHLFEVLMQAFYRAGHSFAQERTGVTGILERLLSQQGCQPVQRRVIDTIYEGETEQTRLFREDMALTFHMLLPFARRWGHVPDAYEQWYQQAIQDMQQPDFRASGRLFTVWGITVQQSDLFFH